jgi:hypothetical protein
MPIKKKKLPVRANETKMAGAARVKKNDPSPLSGLKEHAKMPGFFNIRKNAGVLLNNTKTYLASMLK